MQDNVRFFDTNFEGLNTTSKWMVSIYPFGFKSKDESWTDLKNFVLSFQDLLEKYREDEGSPLIIGYTGLYECLCVCVCVWSIKRKLFFCFFVFLFVF